MITDSTNFRPMQPPRLVAATTEVRLEGPGTRFSAGQLVDARDWRPAPVLQLAASRR
ncbi:hypothetical protein [Nocardioides sp. URHA0020]|uniref:hypothetical protein n=1 Tax=Nocardioides sp. URHA0020 TaxID=1380392 RepID=UPI000AB89488|nr:hypothetical protein [Nocardioides sp. URHA0020]